MEENSEVQPHLNKKENIQPSKKSEEVHQKYIKKKKSFVKNVLLEAAIEVENNCQKDSKIDQNHAEHAMESKVVIEESKHVPVSAEGPKNPRKHVVKGRKPTKSTKSKSKAKTKKEASNQSIRDFFPKMSKVKENEVNVEAEKVEIEVDEDTHQENKKNKKK